MKCTALSLVLAGLLGLAGPTTARADLELTLTPFSGTTTDYSTVGTVDNPDTDLPYTDMYGRTVSQVGGYSESLIEYSVGIYQPTYSVPATPFTLTFSGLAAGTTEAGFLGSGASSQLVSATVSNGDSYVVTTSLPPTFFGFTDTTPFTSITLTFSGVETFEIVDFVTATGTLAVPEPSSLTIAGGVVAACAAAASWRRRRARRGDRDR